MSDKFCNGVIQSSKASFYDGSVRINDFDLSDEEVKHNLQVLLTEADNRGFPRQPEPPNFYKMSHEELCKAVQDGLAEMKYRGHLYKVESFFPKPTPPAPPKVPLEAPEMACAESGRKIHAIKLLKERTGLSLRDAKERIDGYYEEWVAAGKPSGGIPQNKF